MLPLAYVGLTPDELNHLVEGEIWERWLKAEPALSVVGSLDDLHAWRGLSTDGALGALVRLAAWDGGDDELAAIAVVHQLHGGVRRLSCGLADLSDDIEGVVVGALWEKIRTFPWRRRTRAYAANLMLDTKAAVLALLQPGRTRRGPEPVVFIDTTTSCLDAIADDRTRLCSPDKACEEATTELVALLDWARATRVVSGEDVLLLVELIQAGYQVADRETPRTLRGVCSEAAVARVAEWRGVCAKTIVRHRNRVVSALREEAPRFLAEAA